MCSSSMVKPGRSLLRWRHLSTGFVGVVVGALLVILTYLVVSQQFAVSARYVVITKQQRQAADEKGTEAPGDGETEEQGMVRCSSEGYFSESCVVDGDVRVKGTSLSVTLVVPTNNRSERHEWRIRPYAQRSVHNIRKVTVTQLPQDPSAAAPPGTVTYTVPAVLFAIGGHSGRNYFHDFADVLVPLFVASRRYAGEVQFLVSNIVQPQWLDKYKTLLHHLSKYELVHLDGDAHVRCFPRVTVGLHIHKLFSIVPESSTPGVGSRLTMPDFTHFLREAYALPRHAAAVNLAREPDKKKKKKKKPRLLLIRREQYRRLMNEEEITRAAEAAGFDAAATELRGDTPVSEQARAVNSFDAMVGVHGAALTNAAFLPPGAVLVQVVPYGKMESIAASEFGEPATDMGLMYLEYSVAVEESTLLEMLGPEHPAIRDPDSVHRDGWEKVDEFYLRKQDLRINVTRFAPTLARAFHHLRQQH